METTKVILKLLVGSEHASIGQMARSFATVQADDTGTSVSYWKVKMLSNLFNLMAKLRTLCYQNQKHFAISVFAFILYQ